MKRKTAPPEPLGPPLLDIDDVAKHTKVSSRTVRRWIKDEGLPVYRLGDSPRISPDDLAHFLKQRRQRVQSCQAMSLNVQ